MNTATYDRQAALAELVALGLAQSGVAIESDIENGPTLNLPGWSVALSMSDEETLDTALARARAFDEGGTALPVVVSYATDRDLQQQHVTMSLGTFGKLIQRLQERS
jgi:hypothetical protein